MCPHSILAPKHWASGVQRSKQVKNHYSLGQPKVYLASLFSYYKVHFAQVLLRESITND